MECWEGGDGVSEEGEEGAIGDEAVLRFEVECSEVGDGAERVGDLDLLELADLGDVREAHVDVAGEHAREGQPVDRLVCLVDVELHVEGQLGLLEVPLRVRVDEEVVEVRLVAPDHYQFPLQEVLDLVHLEVRVPEEQRQLVVTEQLLNVLEVLQLFELCLPHQTHPAQVPVSHVNDDSFMLLLQGFLELRVLLHSRAVPLFPLFLLLPLFLLIHCQRVVHPSVVRSPLDHLDR